jgi:hypothetical protein
MHHIFKDILLQPPYNKTSEADKALAVRRTYEQKQIKDLEKKCQALSDAYEEDLGDSSRYTAALERRIEVADEILEKTLVQEFKKQLNIILNTS